MNLKSIWERLPGPSFIKILTLWVATCLVLFGTYQTVAALNYTVHYYMVEQPAKQEALKKLRSEMDRAEIREKNNKHREEMRKFNEMRRAMGGW